MSQPYPVIGVQVGGVQPRLELRDLQKNPISWSLFIQALTSLYAMDDKKPNSYAAIAGNHGLPYQQWSGDPNGPATPDQNSQWAGYCHHASVLFPTWHRALLLLMEQALNEQAVEIASKLNNAEWTEAATKLRFPYWDWTNYPEEGIPQICQQTTVEIINVDGSTTKVDNPLNHYTYASKPGVAPGVPYMADWPRTFRWADKNENPTKEMYDESLKAFTSGSRLSLGTGSIDLRPTSWLREKVASLFTYDLTVKDPGYNANMYAYFACTGAQPDGVSPVMNPMPSSVEEPHNMVHLDTGGNGSMSINEYAGFDPIFYLHHCNVDRICVFWQYLYSNYWMDYGWKSSDTGDTVPFVIDSGTFVQDAGSQEDESTPLYPFRDKTLNYWISKQLRSLQGSNFNYTYPSIKDPKTGTEVNVAAPYDLNDQALREQLRTALHNHFTDLQVAVQANRKASLSLSLDPHLSQTLLREDPKSSHLRQFQLVGHVPEFSFPGSYRLEIYILSKDRTQPEGPVVNSISVLGRADPDSCVACRDRRAAGNHVRGYMPLDHHVILHLLHQLDATQRASITSLDHVAAVIHQSIGMRLVRPDGIRLASTDHSVPAHHPALDESKHPKLTLHSHVIKLSRDHTEPVAFYDHTDHGAFGQGAEWKTL